MNHSPLLEDHITGGARVSRTQGDAVILAHGSVPEEYAAGVRSCILIDATTHGSVTVGGSEASAFLHRLLANDVLPLTTGQGNANLLLNPKGKVQARFNLFRNEDGFTLETSADGAAALHTALEMYLFGEDVTIKDTSGDSAPLLLGGPGAQEIAEKLFGPITGGAQENSWQGQPLRITPAEVAGDRGIRIDGGPDQCKALWNSLQDSGATPIGRVAEDSLRVEALRPRWGLDLTEEIYPAEARLEEEFSLTKGCYIGQEVAAKIDTYGGLNKQLFCLALDQDDPVPLGLRLTRTIEGEVRDLGLITTWAYSFHLDQAVGLGYIKKRHQEPGTVFQVGDSGVQGTLLKGAPLRSLQGHWNQA